MVSEPASQVFWMFQSPSTVGLTLLPTQLGVNIDFSTGTLILNSVSEANSGIYTCTWRNPYGEISKTARLAVLGFPKHPEFDVTPSDVTVAETDETVMNCSGYGNPTPSIEWLRKNDKEGDEEVIIAFSRNSSFESGLISNENFISFPLSLINVSKTDFGIYTCRIRNGEGQINGSAYLEVIFAPFFIVQPQATTVREGESLTLVCTASGNPQPTISWVTPGNTTYAYSDTQSSDQNVIVLENGKLNIKFVTKDHSGVFTCIAQNTVGSASVSVTVSISGVPHFIKRPMSIGAIEGDQVKMACEVSASPQASIKWYYKYVADLSVQGTNIAKILASITTPSGQLSITNVTQVNGETSRYSLASDGSLLAITNVQESDAGFYVCHAQNVHGAAFAIAVIRVISFPQFQMTPQNSKVSLGDSVLLNCYSVGIPVPTQRWLFQERKLDVKPGIQELSNGSLLIESITEEYLGKYTCLATNQAGQRSVSAILSFSNKPAIIEAPLNATVKLTEGITLHCKGESPLPMQIFWYESSAAAEIGRLLISGNAEVISNGAQLNTAELLQHQVQLNSDGDLTIPCVDKSNVGWYLCQLKNAEGTVTADPVYVDVLYIPDGLDLTTSPNVLTQSQSVTLSCKAEGFPLPSISWITPSKIELNSSHTTMTGVSIQPSATDPNGALISLLQIQSVESADHGGKWMCKACNVEGCKLKTTDLNIQGIPAIIEVFSEDTGTEVAFTCSPSGAPSPDVVYGSGNNQSGVLNLIGHRIENNVMFVQKEYLRPSYSCNARNIHGISETIVLSPPPTVNISVAAPVEDGARLIFSVDRDIVSLAPSKFVVAWRKVESPEAEWSNTSLSLDTIVDNYMVVLKNILHNDTVLTCRDIDLDALSRQVRSGDDEQGLINNSTVFIDSTGSVYSYKIEIVLTALKANTLYEIRGSLFNALGSGSTSSATRMRTSSSAPAQVTKIKVEMDQLNITVTWVNPEPLNGQLRDVIIRVDIYNTSITPQNLLETKTLGAVNEPKVVFTVPDLGEYSLQITASNLKNSKVGEATTAKFSVEQKTPSFVPKIMQVLVMTSSSLQVKWTTNQHHDDITASDILAPVTGFRIHIRQLSGKLDSKSKGILDIDIFNKSVSHYTVDDLLEHEDYSFRVAATNSAGKGPFSKAIIARTLYEAFSKKAFDEEISDIGISWRLLAIILIVCFSVMIVLIGTILFSVQAKLSKCKSVDLTPPQSSRGRSIEEDWPEIAEKRSNEESLEKETTISRHSEEKAGKTENLHPQSRARRYKKVTRKEHAKETSTTGPSVDGYLNDSFVLY